MVVAGFVLVILGYAAIYSGVSNIMTGGKGLSFMEALIGKDSSGKTIATAASTSQGSTSMLGGISALFGGSTASSGTPSTTSPGASGTPVSGSTPAGGSNPVIGA